MKERHKVLQRHRHLPDNIAVSTAGRLQTKHEEQQEMKRHTTRHNMTTILHNIVLI